MFIMLIPMMCLQVLRLFTLSSWTFSNVEKPVGEKANEYLVSMLYSTLHTCSMLNARAREIFFDNFILALDCH